MNKNIMILIAVLLFIFIVLPLLAWFLFSVDSKSLNVDEQVKETVIIEESQ